MSSHILGQKHRLKYAVRAHGAFFIKALRRPLHPPRVYFAFLMNAPDGAAECWRGSRDRNAHLLVCAKSGTFPASGSRKTVIPLDSSFSRFRTETPLPAILPGNDAGTGSAHPEVR